MESGCEQILKITDRILDGGEITEEEAKALIRVTDEDTMLLLACADKIRQKFSGSSVDLCHRQCKKRTLPGRLQVLRPVCPLRHRHRQLHLPAGRRSHESSPESERSRRCPPGYRYRRPGSEKSERLPAEILHLIRRIRTEIGIEVCCSLGFLTQEQAYQLSEAGVNRLHCNIESAPSSSRKSAPHIPPRKKLRTSSVLRKPASASAAAASSVWAKPSTRESRWLSI